MKIDLKNLSLKKYKWIQILFLSLIFYGLIKNKNESVKFIDNKDETYNHMKEHLILSEFRISIDKYLDKLLEVKELKEIKLNNEKVNEFMLNNKYEYFYIYYSENIVVYLFKREKDKDKIYFEGLRKFKEINNFSLPKIIKNKGILTIKDELIKEKGICIKFENNSIIKIIKNIDLINLFIHFKENIYKKDNENENENENQIENEKIKIEMEGFSLGGLYSQLFIYNLHQKELLKDVEINYINIESWFGGNKEYYEVFNKICKTKNIMTYGSLFYLYNKFLQKYNKIDEAIYIDDTDELIFTKYMKQPFPYGIIDYIKNYHIIKDFLPKIE